MMKILFLTNEYPPHTYGGAGVHVDYLSRELAGLAQVDVRCFGDQHAVDVNPRVQGFELDNRAETWACPKPLKSIFGSAQRCLDFNAAGVDADVVHCHTWYTHLGGIMAKLNYGISLVVTTHSLEPLRPWKREQLGGGYNYTCWVEKTALEMADAVVAVSKGARDDVQRLFNVVPERVRVIHNGIDPNEYRRVSTTVALERYGIDPRQPYLLFVGRITRQKGIIYLTHAVRYMDPGLQVVLCAGAPDTPEIAVEMQRAVGELSAAGRKVVWIEKMLDKASIIEMYSHAALFCCPSIYEPFGIINLEAMACETPVVAAAVGGIPEVVQHEETGLLVPLEQADGSPFAPLDPDRFARDLAAAVNRLMTDEALRGRMAANGRMRVEQHFSWSSIAAQTRDLYAELIANRS